jgi:AcrR family transcriptional regulator
VARAETKERLLQAVVRTLASVGYGKTTARAIAKTGGFAPGVIYYHYTDLDDLFIETARFTSARRLERYMAETKDFTSAADLVTRLRSLYDEDTAEGHIAAIQELVAAAVASPRLAVQVKEETARWQALAESVITKLVDGSPIADIVPVPELASAAVATYLGLEMLSHLHADRNGPEQMFQAAHRLALLIDAYSSTNTD